MRSGFGPALLQRLRRVDPTARQIVVAEAELASDVVQNAVNPHNWTQADSLTGLTITADQAVQLANSGPGIAAQTTGNDTEVPLGAVFSTPTAFFAARILFEAPNEQGVPINTITAYLNPQNNGSLPISVTAYKLQLFLLNPLHPGSYAPWGTPLVVPAPTSAGDVTFAFGANGPPCPGVPHYLEVVITPLTNTYAVAENAVWGADSTISSVGLIYFPSWSASGATLNGPIGSTDTIVTVHTPTDIPYLFTGGYLKIDSETIFMPGQPPSVVLSNQLVGLVRGVNFTTAASHADTTPIQVTPGGRGNVVQGVEFTWNPATQVWGDAPAAGILPRVTVELGAYSPATITFSTNQYDLGASPTEPVQFVVRGDVPNGTTILAEVLDDGGSTWRTVTDGMYTTDPSLGGNVSARQHYKLRATLTPNTPANTTPILRSLGVREVTVTDLSDVAEIVGGRWAFDPITLKGEIGEFTLRAIRDGTRDYADLITALMSQYDLTSLLFRWFWGWYDDPKTLTASSATRAQWGHVDDLIVDDTSPLGPALELTLLSPLALVKQALPRYDPQLRLRPALSYPNTSVPTASLDLVDLDILQNQLGSALAPRWIGSRLPAATVPVPAASGGGIIASTAATPSVVHTDAAHGHTGTFTVTITGSSDNTINATFTATVVDSTHFSVPVTGLGGTGGSWSSPAGSDTTILVAKTIVSTDTNPAPGRPAVADDAKLELDALAFLAGYTNITSQGKLKAVNVFGTQPVQVVFAQGEVLPQSVLPGFRQRVPEFWVPWGWNGTQYPFLSYSVNLAALTALGNATIDPRPIDDAVAQWIITQTGDAGGVSSLADAIGTRMVNTVGLGLILWTFRTTYRFPELEPSDVVAVPTDWFVAHDPIGARAVAGLGYGLGIIQACDSSGQEFAVWIQSYANLIGYPQAATKVVTPLVTVTVYVAGGNVVVNWVGNPSVASVDIGLRQSATDDNIYVLPGTAVDGQIGTQATAATGGAHYAFVTVTPYTSTGGAGTQGQTVKAKTTF